MQSWTLLHSHHTDKNLANLIADEKTNPFAMTSQLFGDLEWTNYTLEHTNLRKNLFLSPMNIFIDHICKTLHYMEYMYVVCRTFLMFLVESIFKIEPNEEVMLALMWSRQERLSLQYTNSTQRLVGASVSSGDS